MSVIRALTELEIGLISRAISATNPYHLQAGQRIAFEGIRAVFNHRLATGTPRLSEAQIAVIYRARDTSNRIKEKISRQRIYSSDDILNIRSNEARTFN